MTPEGGEGGREVPEGERFPRAARIRCGREIRSVFREGRRVREGPIEVFARPSPAGRPRVAVVVPRHGRSIVQRNRVRRRLREIARREWLPDALERGDDRDAAIRARPGAYDAEFDELREALLHALEDPPCDASCSG